MIKSKLIRVSHNRLFRSKIKHRNHGRRIGSSDICPDVSSSVSCPINFSYTHNTTIRAIYRYVYAFLSTNYATKPILKLRFRNNFPRPFSPFRNAKTTRPRSTVYHVRRNAYRNSRPAERSDGNGSDTQKKKPEYSGIATPPFYGRTRGSMTARISKC